MKPKDLFADIPDPEDDPYTGEQVFFGSLAEVCRPVQAWMESNLGRCSHGSTFKYLSCELYGVTVRAWIYDTYVEWGVKWGGRGQSVGYTRTDEVDKLDAKIPPVINLVAAYIKLRGGSGL